MKPRVMLIRTAGTNCDEETAFAFSEAGAVVDAVHIHALVRKPDLLTSGEYHILVFPGGFSYGDDLGSAVILAHEIQQHLADPIRSFIDQGGLVMGICNGFQVLVKTGLLPGGTKGSRSDATLTFNDSQRFEDRWIWLEVGESESPFLKGMSGRQVTFPVAHGEGKFMLGQADQIEQLKANKQLAFRYIAADGSEAEYPANPNGSPHGIAGITDESGHILGLMPHPERHLLPWHHPRWTREGLPKEGHGLFLFKNAVNYASSNS